MLKMTNPKTRKTGKKSSMHRQQQNGLTDRTDEDGGGDGDERADATEDDGQCEMMSTWMQQESTEEADGSLTPTPTENNELDEEDTDSCSSFSLQECIDQFHARRIRRKSTQSRDAVEDEYEGGGDGDATVRVVPVDEDLINQNRTNREHERKCKPCENGFCYCFTSDSGDGGGDGGGVRGCGGEARGAHVRYTRRHRKSESSQGQQTVIQPQIVASAKERQHSSNYKSPKKVSHIPQSVSKLSPATHNSSQLTAISRLETTSPDAPLIHIIQELHDNCVISEVRVNRHKIQAQQHSKPSPKKTQFKFETADSRHDNSPTKTKRRDRASAPLKQPSPSAPPLDKASEFESDEGFEGFVYSSPLNSSSKSHDSQRQRHKSAGRLLQKRLSNSHIQFKPRNLNEPPPKPPRSSIGFEDKSSVSTLASTTPSVREAERILDDFLRKRGVKVPLADTTTKPIRRSVGKGMQTDTVATLSKDLARREYRKSYPITQLKDRRTVDKPLPSCPSLSDIERLINGKKTNNFEKNLRQTRDKPIKEISFGWKEPRIEDMLNYEASPQRKTFVSQAVQAEPQSHIGWQMPPKLELDTVDGEVRYNLASNIEQKNTPVKTRFHSTRKPKMSTRHTKKFILSEQLRNLSPWTRKGSTANSVGRAPPYKSNLKTASRAFLRSSKRKILRLVSPKKDNREPHEFVARKTPKRMVGVQTSPADGAASYENSSTPQSPPGSYHSAVQTSQQSSNSPLQNSHDIPASHFDFTRTVRTPPRKATRTSHRRLNFPLNCVDSDCIDGHNDKAATLTKTYRSYQSDLDQDMTLSKMGYILGNIRAKLEASDNRAERTFQETAQRGQRNASFDCPDSFEVHRAQRHRVNRRLIELEHDPIYSEIEEDSLHIAGSPNFDNKTGVEHFPVQHNPEVLYAKINKAHKSTVAPPPPPPPPPTTSTPSPPAPSISTPTSLGKIIHDSLKQRYVYMSPEKPLPPPPSAAFKSRHSDVSYTSIMMPTQTDCTALVHCQSLNNIRVMEHNSPPKPNRNLSKSDLSLQRSEIFLENLCRSEFKISTERRLEKVENQPNVADVSYTSVPAEDIEHSSLNASYELVEASVYDYSDSNAAGSYLGLDMLASKHTRNQSTPMKQQTMEQQTMRHDAVSPRPKTFLTKLQGQEMPVHHPELSIAVSNDSLRPCEATQLLNQSCSCPTTPHSLPPLPNQQEKRHAVSLDAVYTYHDKNNTNASQNNNNNSANNDTSLATQSRFKRLKNVLRLSLRRSKNFVKAETKRLSTSLSFPTSPCTPTAQRKIDAQNQSYSTCSDFDLDALFSLDDEAPVGVQLAKAVSICRQLPDLEISAEMVEAERLLLYSTLRRDARRLQLVKLQQNHQIGQHNRRFFIDGMRLPIKANASQDIFFNYFYICTFEYDGAIMSTQSVECCNGEAIFDDCGIEFSCNATTQQCHEATENEYRDVNCKIFMLRLRKVSTLSLEPQRRVVKLPALLTPSPTSSSSSGSEEIVSRFRLHATFTLHARDFAPFEYVEIVSKHANCICLRASRNYQSIPLTLCSKSTNLEPVLLLTGRAEMRFPKHSHRGYLNVQNPYTLHNWNRRWCTLDDLQLSVWPDETGMTEQPLLNLELCTNQQTTPLEAAARELCARPRSFCLQCVITKRKTGDGDGIENADYINATAAVFFAADSQDDLNAWLHELNLVLKFTKKWLYK